MLWMPDINPKNIEHIYFNIMVGYFESSPNRKEFLPTI